jgi:hypothetical protein
MGELANPAPDTTAALTVDSAQSIHARLDRFFWYGFIIGGVVPPALVFIADLNFVHLIPQSHKTFFLNDLLISFLLSTPLFRFGFKLYAKKDKIANGCLRCSALVSLFALHFLVLCTGGSSQSYLSYHYLYIPAVVAISFRGNTEFTFASALCFLSFLLNLFCIDQIGALALPCSQNNPEWITIMSGAPYRFAHLGVFTIQLSVLAALRRLNVEPAAGKT